MSQIQLGKSLKKTVINDKSQPVVDASRKETGLSSAPSSTKAGPVGPMNMANLFAGGVPKLKSASSMKGPSAAQHTDVMCLFESTAWEYIVFIQFVHV